MTHPQDDPTTGEPAGLQQVQAAYRDLPPVEPQAALDARVRAAVAAQLAADAQAPAIAAARPVSRGRVVPLPRWRRVALPLATAAMLVIGVGLWRMRAPDEAVTASVARPQVAAPPAAPAQLPAEVDLKAARVPMLAQAPRRRAEPDALVMREMADAAPTAGAYASSPSPARTTAREPAAPPFAALASPPGPEAAARDRNLGVVAKRIAPADAEISTFDAIRRLLAQQRRDEARTLLERWQAAHAGATVPKDLLPLLDPVPPHDVAR